jgi:hypothetical protein
VSSNGLVRDNSESATGKTASMSASIIRSLLLECESEDSNSSAPRVCNLLASVRVGDRDDCWLAEVDPPFSGRELGLSTDKISRIVIATKWEGYSLLDGSREAIPVYVARILGGDEAPGRTIGASQISVILWCFAKQTK